MSWKFYMSIVWEAGRSSQRYWLLSPASSKMHSPGHACLSREVGQGDLQGSLPTSAIDSAVPPHVQWQVRVRRLNATSSTLCSFCHLLVAQCLQKKSSFFSCAIFLCFPALSFVSCSQRDLLILLTCTLAMAKFCFDRFSFWSCQIQRVIFLAWEQWFKLGLFWNWSGSLCVKLYEIIIGCFIPSGEMQKGRSLTIIWRYLCFLHLSLFLHTNTP